MAKKDSPWICARASFLSPDPWIGGWRGGAWHAGASAGRQGWACSGSGPSRSGGVRQVRASHEVSAVFDDSDLAGSASLVPVVPVVPVVRLAARAGLGDVLGERLGVSSPDAGAGGGRGGARRCGPRRQPGRAASRWRGRGLHRVPAARRRRPLRARRCPAGGRRRGHRPRRPGPPGRSWCVPTRRTTTAAAAPSPSTSSPSPRTACRRRPAEPTPHRVQRPTRRRRERAARHGPPGHPAHPPDRRPGPDRLHRPKTGSVDQGSGEGPIAGLGHLLAGPARA